MTRVLERLRRDIDSLDERLVALVAERVRLASAVAAEKANQGAPLLDPAREEDVVARAAVRASAAQLDPEEVRALVRRLLALSRRAQLGAYEAARTGTPGRARDAGDGRGLHP